MDTDTSKNKTSDKNIETDLRPVAIKKTLLEDRYLPVMKHLRSSISSKQLPFGDKEVEIPVSHYLSQARFDLEREKLFKRIPLFITHSSTLSNIGDYIKYDYFGTPTLLVRSKDGNVRCFLNSCQHRGAQLNCPKNHGNVKTFVCPYHGWTYETSGELKHIPYADAFEKHQVGKTRLKELAVEEKYGLIWLVPQASKQTLDDFIHPISKDLDGLNLDQYTHFKTSHLTINANWKLIVEAFLEGYHIQRLHRKSVAPFFVEAGGFGAYLSPHIMTASTRKKMMEVTEAQINELSFTELATFTYLIFPITKLLLHPDYISLMTMVPTSAESFNWTHLMLVPKNRMTPDEQEHWEDSFNLVEKGVFQREDLAIAESMHRGLKTGALDYTTLGKMETPAQWLHQSIEQYIAN